MRLRLSPHVPGDLDEIADYIAQDSPRQAIRVLRNRHNSPLSGLRATLSKMPVFRPPAKDIDTSEGLDERIGLTI